MSEETTQLHNVLGDLNQLQDQNIGVDVEIPFATESPVEEDILENEDLKKAEEYYDLHANTINKKYSQGYQIALIKNPKCKSKSLKIQNFSYIADLVPITVESFIAEVGCGNGQFINYLSTIEKYRGVQYFGIDISENQLKNAEKSTSYEQKSFAQVDMHEFFSFEPYFDTCYFIESIGYATDLETVVQSISSGIKLGGHVVIKNPVRIVANEEKYQEIKKRFADIESEYGYGENCLGMLPDKDFIEKTFLDNGFELEKFEVPEYDTETYNKTFCKDTNLCDTHPSYVNHILNMEPESYYPNQYLECAIFVFKKVKDIIVNRNEGPEGESNAVSSNTFEKLLNEQLDSSLVARNDDSESTELNITYE